MSRSGTVPLSGPLSALLVVIASFMPFGGQDVAVVAWCGVALALNLRVRLRLDELVVPVPIIVLLVWITLSATWSVDPVGTIQGAGQAALLVVAAAVVAARRTSAEVLDVVALGMKVVVGLTWLVALALPGVGRTQDAYQAGSLEGLSAHRNLLAYVSVLALVTFLAQAAHRSPGPARGRSLGWAALTVLTLLATRSSTALLVAAATGAVVLALVVVLLLRPGLRRLVAVPVVGAAGLVIWLGVANLDTVARTVGRDPTLTGRTDIWAVVLRAIGDRPLQGYGWDALWTPGNALTERLWAEGGFPFFHAHDGYLDVALQVGVVGLVLHLVAVGAVLVGSGREYLMRPGPLRAWPLLLLVVVLAYNVSETVLPVHVGWLLVALLGSALARGGPPRSPRPTPAPTRIDEKV